MIVGLISPDSGSVLVSNGDGTEDITNMPMYQRAHRVFGLRFHRGTGQVPSAD
jgi:ABC-type lipopolysaccharide export system ATPase subunit